MKRTLRFRLTISVLVLLGVVLVSFSGVLYAAFRRALWKSFDQRMESEAEALGHMLEEHSKQRFVFEYAGIDDFEQKEHPAFFEIWHPEGKVLARSRSLQEGDLTRKPGDLPRPLVWRGTLPDGRKGRFMQAAQLARWESGSIKIPPLVRQPATIVIGRGTEDADAALAQLQRLLFGLGTLALVVAGGAAAVTVSRGLRPAVALAAEIGRVDESQLGRRISVPNLPRELEPPVAKLNELLAHLDDSFARERRFTSDVSHELRTPLAGLQSILEVATSRERSAADYQAAMAECIGIVRQMHVLIENLLMLARLDANQIEVLKERILLHTFVEECWRPYAPKADARSLTFHNETGPRRFILTDRDKLRLVLTNLLSNAVEYTTAGGHIRVTGGDSDGVLLDVCDSGPPIPPDVLPRIFERFFRADAARSGSGSHCGIGLSLVKALCPVLNITAAAHNLPDGSVRFRLAHVPAPDTRPGPAPRPPEDGRLVPVLQGLPVGRS